MGHLAAFHKTHHEKYLEQRAEVDKLREKARFKKPERSVNPSSQLKLVGANSGFGAIQLESRHDPEAQARYDRARVLFAAMTMTPFHALKEDHIYVKALLPKTHQKITNKSGQTISRHSHDYAEQLRRDIMSIIQTVLEQGNDLYSFTTDMYKTRNMFSLISLTFHFMDKNFDLRRLVLFADYFGNRRHTGANILMALDTMMKEAGLDGPNITRVMLLDNASNNKLAMSLGRGDYISLWCAIHTLQLVIVDSLKVKVGTVRVLKVAQKCKEVSKTVRRSEANRDALKEACKSTNINFIYPEKPGGVRWNSKQGNIASCLKLKPALQRLSFYDEGDTWSTSVPTAREFEVAESVNKCLLPFKVATKCMEADRVASLHQVVKQLFEIKCSLEDLSRSSQNVKMFAKHLSTQVERRFKNCGTTNKWYAVAHFLGELLIGTTHDKLKYEI